MGLLKGRRRNGPELTVGSLVLWTAFGHLQAGPRSPSLAPRDRYKMLQEARVRWGWAESRTARLMAMALESRPHPHSDQQEGGESGDQRLYCLGV